MAHGFLSSVFQVFDRHRTAIDLIAPSEVSLSLTMADTRPLHLLRRHLVRRKALLHGRIRYATAQPTVEPTPARMRQLDIGETTLGNGEPHAADRRIDRCGMDDHHPSATIPLCARS